VVDGDHADAFQGVPAKAPLRKFRKRTAGGNLIILGETALDREVPNKSIYLLVHIRNSGQRTYNAIIRHH